ncbi:MAG: long-chain-fatty-acid--CoA ligase [Proteobacteria bacterium]|nr:long-chain-fatty-acid--CoA ligase [Pseudomonadota bacterium]
MEKIWLKSYPKNVPAEIDPNVYRSVVDVFEKSCRKYNDRIAFTNMDKDMTFEGLDRLSEYFAAYLQSIGLKKGDRIAIQMPNLLQYPVAMFGALRAGLVIVNTNPLYTAREMEHQFNDSGAKAVVILSNFADKLEEVLPKCPNIEHVIVTGLGDLLGFPKNLVVNFVVRFVKKLVPKYKIPTATTFSKALLVGALKRFQRPDIEPSDIAFLQYTGGTTGVAKGAVLTHRNVVSNMEQISVWMSTIIREAEEIIITPLPLYHIFSLTVNCLVFMKAGAQNVLITNPKDLPGFIKEIKKYKFTVFTAVNTLYNALVHHPDFESVNFNYLKASVGGGMAVQSAVADKWRKITGVPLVEGYGLTETAPVLCVNRLDGYERIGTIGLPIPSTLVTIRDDNEKEVAQGETGEICAKGPQVMPGYWQRPDETKKVFTEDGWFKSGDIGFMDADGYFRIVDRKKDMILVSGFNVYPNEIEEVMAQHPGVLEVAAIGVPDEKSGEVVKIFVVKKSETLTAQTLKEFAREKLTAYKVPKYIEFRTELPKSNVGKILRKELRAEKPNP